MMKTINKFLILLMLAIPFVGFSGCSDDDIDVSEVTLDKTTLTLEVGQSEKLVATVKPTDATDKTVTWTSDNTAVATVDAAGEVTAVKDGTATITAKAGGKEATCAVTITPDDYATVIEGSYTGALTGTAPTGPINVPNATITVERTSKNNIKLSTSLSLPVGGNVIPIDVTCDSPVGKNTAGNYTIEGETKALSTFDVIVTGEFDDAGAATINISVTGIGEFTFTGTKAE